MVESIEDKTISRRGAIAAAGATALALAAVSMTGCSSGDDSASTDKTRDYLPIGSVVKLSTYENSDIKHAVITRRPYLSKYYSKDSAGNLTETKVEKIYDYALVAWPTGIINDINMVAGDIVLADSADIKEVLFVGYEDDIEKRAQEALVTGKSSNLTNAQSLKDIATELLYSIKEEGN